MSFPDAAVSSTSATPIQIPHRGVDHAFDFGPVIGQLQNATSEVFRAFHGGVVDDKFVANTVTYVKYGCFTVYLSLIHI